MISHVAARQRYGQDLAERAAEFAEDFLDGVRAPLFNVIGGLNNGWRVAMTTLMNERVAIGGGISARTGGPIDEALAIWRQRGGGTGIERKGSLIGANGARNIRIFEVDIGPQSIAVGAWDLRNRLQPSGWGDLPKT